MKGKEKMSTIDLSTRRRRYYREKSDLKICPECGADLIEENCPILLCAKSDTDETEFITSLSGSHFCKKCLVVMGENLAETTPVIVAVERNIKNVVEND